MIQRRHKTNRNFIPTPNMEYDKILATEPEHDNVNEIEESCLAFDINQDENNCYQKLQSNGDQVSKLR